MREALAKSDNAAAQKLLEEVGAANVVEFAHAAGIESRLEPTPSLALGAYEVRPIEIANAYATYASGGTYASPVLVTKIVGPDGKELALPERPPTRRVLGEDEAYLITSLMRSVVTDGTGKRALSLGRPVVGKTGTTNRAKDAWFVGYSTDIVAAVWVGYDDALPLGWGESGGVTALPAWVDFMKQAHEGKPAVEFARPSSVLTAKIDPASGLIAWPGQEDAIDEVFLDGTVPGEAATPDAGSGRRSGSGRGLRRRCRVHGSRDPAGRPDARRRRRPGDGHAGTDRRAAAVLSGRRPCELQLRTKPPGHPSVVG